MSRSSTPIARYSLNKYYSLYRRIRSSRFLIPILIAVSVGIYFWPTMVQYFAIDDFGWLLYGGKDMNNITAWVQAFMHINGSGQYRPLSQQVFFFLGYSLFGLNPLGFHVINTLVYITSCIFVFKFLESFTKSKPLAICATFIFCFSPIHIEHLFWVSAFTETLATLCTAMAFYYLMKGNKVGLALAYILGLMSNETAIIIPVFAALYYLLIQNIKIKDIWSKTRSLWIILLMYTLLRLTVFGGLGAKGVFMAVFSPRIWIEETFHSFQAALGFGPVMNNVMSLNIFLKIIVMLFLILFVLAILYSLIKSRRDLGKYRIVLLGLSVFIVGLLPVLPFANNYAYYTASIPVIGLSIVFIGIFIRSYAPITILATFFLLTITTINIYAPGGLFRVDGFRYLEKADYSAYIAMKAFYLSNNQPLRIRLVGRDKNIVKSGLPEMAQLIDRRSVILSDKDDSNNLTLSFDSITGTFKTNVR